MSHSGTWCVELKMSRRCTRPSIEVAEKVVLSNRQWLIIATTSLLNNVNFFSCRHFLQLTIISPLTLKTEEKISAIQRRRLTHDICQVYNFRFLSVSLDYVKIISFFVLRMCVLFNDTAGCASWVGWGNLAATGFLGSLLINSSLPLSYRELIKRANSLVVSGKRCINKLSRNLSVRKIPAQTNIKRVKLPKRRKDNANIRHNLSFA